MAAKLLIVGAGATGSLTASLLARSIPDLSITVWEKAREGGGRMMTHRSLDKTDHVDLGAQYITRYKTINSDQFIEELKTEMFQELIDHKLLIAFNGRIEDEPPDERERCGHFVSPTGVSSVPKYFLDKSSVDVHFSYQLQTININIKQQLIECGWINDSSNEEKWTEFKSLILTLPVPQILTLKGNLIKQIDQSDFCNLKLVQYSSRYALGMFFKGNVPQYHWTAKYYKHPIIRYICWDNLKRGNVSLNTSLLIHTAVPFGLEHLDDDRETVKELIISSLHEVLPDIPTPTHSKLICWKYSQVYKPYPGTPGYLVLHKNPLVVATGDAFTHSNLEGCIEAAYHTSRIVKQFLSEDIN